MQWLSPTDMEAIYIREFQRRSQPCGQWLLCDEVFGSWLCSSQPRGIWITGPPGSGKTVLSTCIIDAIRERMRNNSRCVSAFFYCDKGEDKLSLTTILACLISQVLAQLDNVPRSISAAFNIAKRYGRSKVSVADQPMSLLEDSIRSLEKVNVIIDGLDELQDAPAVAESLRGLLERTDNVQLIFLSRDLPTLSNRLCSFPRISLTPAVMAKDINNYISLQLLHLPLDDAEIRNHIFDKLSYGANGMFLWANLMIQALKSATSPQEMLELLCDLPVGLNTIYVSILNRIGKEPPNRQSTAKRVFLWICCSARPLHWNELEAILAFDNCTAQIVESRKPFKSAVLELCSPLIEYVPEVDSFRPAHLSVREFLLCQGDQLVSETASQFFIQEQQGHLEMAQVCLAYQAWYDKCDPTNTSAAAHHFLKYATLFWCHHLSSSTYSSTLNQRIADFLSAQHCRQAWILRFIFWQSSTFPLQYIMKQQKLLKDWIARGQKKLIQDRWLDWIQDTQEILLLESYIFDKRAIHNQFFSNVMSNISYFEKLMVIRDLSREYTMSGRLAEGEKWLTNALDIQQRRLGQENIATVWLLNSLGIIYDQQQRVELSARTQEHALAMQEAILGVDHLETIWTVNELGRIYRHLGNFAKAEHMHLRALRRLREALHPNDPQIAWTLNTLARNYRKQSRYREAISLHNEALAIQKKLLGEKHPHSLWALMDVAACYREQGRLKESAELYRKALDGRLEVLGLSHADTFWAMNNLGIVLEQLGDVEAAMALQEKALSGQIELLGREHKHTMWTIDVLDRLKVQSANGEL